jgi:RNA polymerase sigma-70 factor (sigma-E family)
VIERAEVPGARQVADHPLQDVFERHHPAILRLCTLLTRDPTVAEDLAQEAFVRVAPKAGTLSAEEIRPYLRRVVVNLWKNRIRRIAYEARARGRLVERPSEGTSLEGRDEMWAAITRLPPRQRACLVLRFYEDLSVRDTAMLLRCSEGTVKSQTSKALGKLRKEWRP